jgi:uncharacterized lipoprotein YddW (UPF0748 family)
MHSGAQRLRLALVAFSAFVCSQAWAVSAQQSPAAGRPASSEVRALWVQRATITSPSSIRALVQAAKTAGFNTLLVQVRGRGDAYYHSQLEPRPATLSKQPPTFDPLATVLAEAHPAGLRVHAWINANLVADADPSPLPDHLVYTHPEWLMVPRDLAAELWQVNPRSDEYLGALSRYARAHADRIEGLYASPLQPAAAEHTLKVIADIAERYAVDGIHLDYIRFPSSDFDYSAAAIARFRQYVQARLTDAERRQYDARTKIEPLFYTQMLPQRWQEFRQEQLTDLVTRIRAAVKVRRPNAVLSAAVFPDAAEAASRRLQDWEGWLRDGLLDAVCPMAYTTDPAIFRSQISKVRRLAGDRPVWAGIGAFQLSSLETVLNIRAARELGARGVILFSYDNLVGSNASGNYLSTVGHDAFEKQ